MADNPTTAYPGKIAAPSSKYPYGEARNITLPGDGTGTPWVARLVNDIFGLQQVLLTDSLIVPSGTPDTVDNSQYMDALRKLLGGVEDNTAAMVARDYKVGVLVATQGSTNKTDERAVWRIVAGSTGTADGINYIDLDNGNQAENIRLSSANIEHEGTLLSVVLNELIARTPPSPARFGSIASPRSTLDVVTAIIGDDISVGTGSGAEGLHYWGWTQIMARMLSGEHGSDNYLACMSPDACIDGQAEHDLWSFKLKTPSNWTAIRSTTDSVTGMVWRTNVSGETITITGPTSQRYLTLWYMVQPGGGAMTVSGDTYSVGHVIITGGPAADGGFTMAIKDNGYGAFTVTLTITGGVVDFSGFGLHFGDNGNQLRNFSSKQRSLATSSTKALTHIIDSDRIILALGHHDQVAVDADPKGAAGVAFTQRISHIISEVNTNSRQLVVADFCWLAPDSSFTRLELKRAAFETGGVYVPFPNLIKPSGVVADATYLVNTTGYFRDTTQPNQYGNHWIAGVIAKYMGLGCTSAVDAIQRHDYFIAFQLYQPDFINVYTEPWRVSGSRFVGGAERVKIWLKNKQVIPATASWTIQDTVHAKKIPQYEPFRAYCGCVPYNTYSRSIGLTREDDGAVVFHHVASTSLPGGSLIEDNGITLDCWRVV